MHSGERLKPSIVGSEVRSAALRVSCGTLRSAGDVHFLVCVILINGKVDVTDISEVDMAVPYNETPSTGSEFANMRDSFYILMNLNQYKMKPVISMTREAEGLLRIAIFSKELKLVGRRKTLSQMRDRLAQDLRINRRRGVVPIFISTLWFVFALGISIEAGTFDSASMNFPADFLSSI